jgi:hypothetical protein
MIDDESAPLCKNCASPMVGEYCSNCGQRVDVELKPIGKWLADGFDFLFDVNFKALRTIAILVIKPGYVIGAYLIGQRTEFTSPLRLCLILLAVFVGGDSNLC